VEWDVADVTEEPSVADRPALTFADTSVPTATPAASRRASIWPAVLLVGSDALLILIGFALAYWMRYNVSWPAPFNRIVQEVLTANYVSFANFLPYGLLLTVVLLTLFAM
jgi:hypothetical protein